MADFAHFEGKRQRGLPKPRNFRLACAGDCATTNTLNPDATPTVPSAATPRSTTGVVDRQVYGIGGWRAWLLWPLALLLRVWGMTLRFDVTPGDLELYNKRDEPLAFVVWHNRLFLTFEIFRRYRSGRPISTLISASKDGAWLDAFFGIVGMQAVRGSSSRFGREAAQGLVEALRAGNDIGITPDGPRGPCYDLKPGALIVTRRTHTPMLLVGGDFSSAWQLSSWDRFYLPKPFSTVRLRGELITGDQLANRDAATALIRERMLQINPDRAAGRIAVI